MACVTGASYCYEQVEVVLDEGVDAALEVLEAAVSCFESRARRYKIAQYYCTDY